MSYRLSLGKMTLCRGALPSSVIGCYDVRVAQSHIILVQIVIVRGSMRFEHCLTPHWEATDAPGSLPDMRAGEVAKFWERRAAMSLSRLWQQ